MGSKSDDLVCFMLGAVLRVEVIRTDRSGELKWEGGIKRDDPIIWSAVPNCTVCEHCRWCVQPDRSAVCALWLDICGQCVARQTRVRENIVVGRCISPQGVNVDIPWD